LTFKDADQFDVGKLYDEGLQPSFSRCKLADGLLNVLAGSNYATYNEIIEKAAAAAGIKARACISPANIGQGNRIIIEPVIDFRKMTFDELSYAITHIQIAIPLNKMGDVYYFGSCGSE